MNLSLWQIALIGPLECNFDIEMLTYKLLVCDRQWRIMALYKKWDFRDATPSISSESYPS